MEYLASRATRVAMGAFASSWQLRGSSRFNRLAAKAGEKHLSFCRDYRLAFCYNARVEPDFVCQGRSVSPAELEWLRSALATHPDWSRKRLARELCQRWQWRTTQGRLKDFAARSFLLKLEARGLLVLPPLREQYRTRRWEPTLPSSPPPTAPARIEGPLAGLQPLRWSLPLAGSREESRVHEYLG